MIYIIVIFKDTPEWKEIDPDLNNINELRKLKKEAIKK